MPRRPSARIVCPPPLPDSEPWAAPPPARLPWQHDLAASRTRPDDLTDREWQVVVLITHGYSNDEIAERLFLGVNTVKTHIRSSYRRIGARTRSQAAVWGCVHGLLTADVGTAGAWTDRGIEPAQAQTRPA